MTHSQTLKCSPTRRGVKKQSTLKRKCWARQHVCLLHPPPCQGSSKLGSPQLNRGTAVASWVSPTAGICSFLFCPFGEDRNSRSEGQLRKQDTGVFILLSKHQHEQQGSSGWFMRWECFFELHVRWGCLSRVESNTPRLSLLKSTQRGFTQVVTAAARYSKWRPPLPCSLSPALTKSTHHRRPFSFYLFPRRALPCTFQTQDTKQETELGFVYRNSLLEYKELLVIITEECWLIPGALQYSWGIIIDFSFLPTGIVLVISHCSCKVRRLMLLKSHLGSSCGRCCTM